MVKKFILTILTTIAVLSGQSQEVDYEIIALDYIIKNDSIIDIDSSIERIRIANMVQYHDVRSFYNLISFYPISNADKQLVDKNFKKESDLLVDAIKEWNKIHEEEIPKTLIPHYAYNGTRYISKKMTRKSELFLMEKCSFYISYKKFKSKKIKYQFPENKNKYTLRYMDVRNKNYASIFIYHSKMIPSENIAIVEVLVSNISPFVSIYIFIDSSGKVLKHYRFSQYDSSFYD